MCDDLDRIINNVDDSFVDSLALFNQVVADVPRDVKQLRFVMMRNRFVFTYLFEM